MSYPVEEQLVIGVASSALFDLAESDAVFRTEGVDAYREYQRAHEEEIALNTDNPTDRPVEVVLLSRNDPDTGLRVMKSIRFHGLDITRAAFRSGRNPFDYAEAFNASLCLSAHPDDVARAVASGIPAAQVMETAFTDDAADDELRIAFDFDGVIADDSAEIVFKNAGLAEFLESERKNATVPMPEGPLHKFFTEIAKLQALERSRRRTDGTYRQKIRVAIVTARNAPAHERVVTTLRTLGITVDETFFLGGIEKAKVLKVLRRRLAHYSRMTATSPERVTRAMNGPGLWAHIL
jgi:5'-nucleotidase